jgi:cysteinyl-tRNA synthetase
MSKSSGEFLTLSVLTSKGYDPMDYRFFILGGHIGPSSSSPGRRWTQPHSQRQSVRSHRCVESRSRSCEEPGGGGFTLVRIVRRTCVQRSEYSEGLADLWGLLKDDTISPAEKLAAALPDGYDPRVGFESLSARQAEESIVDDPEALALGRVAWRPRRPATMRSPTKSETSWTPWDMP